MRNRILPKRLPQPQSSDAAEREYYRNLTKYCRAYIALTQSALEKVIHDLKTEVSQEIPKELKTNSIGHMDANAEKTLKILLEEVQNKLKDQFPDKKLRKWSEMMVAHSNDISKKNTVKIAKAVDLDIEPLMKDGKLNPFFKNIVEENVGLIRSITEGKVTTFKNALVSAITDDKPNLKIAEILKKYFDGNLKKAKMIARDQTAKLNGKLNQYRQQQLGGIRYRWRTSNDERVRKDHKSLNNKVCYWSDPPITNKKTGAKNHPGMDYQCRCTAEMILSDVID